MIAWAAALGAYSVAGGGVALLRLPTIARADRERLAGSDPVFVFALVIGTMLFWPVVLALSGDRG